MGRLLIDKEIGDLLDLEKEFTYPCSDGSKTTTIDCHNIVQVQDAKTLKAVGEWLERKELEFCRICEMIYIRPNYTEALLRGEIP